MVTFRCRSRRTIPTEDLRPCFASGPIPRTVISEYFTTGGRKMSGKIARKLVAAAVLLAVSLTTGDVARQATKGEDVAAAAPISATDETKVPHYFGPYPNWANSPQVLADAVVEIGLGTPTPIAVGNPLTARANATDYATPPGVLGSGVRGPSERSAARRHPPELPDLEPGGSCRQSHAVRGRPVPRLRAAPHRNCRASTPSCTTVGNSPFRRSPIRWCPKSRRSRSRPPSRCRPATCSASTARASRSTRESR